VRFPSLLAASLCVLALGLSPTPAAGQACTDSNGTFRFLNDTFPTLSTNGPVFTGQLVVANADGPVTFTEDAGSADALVDIPLSLDSTSGLVTGLAENSGNYDIVFRADDTTQFVTHPVTFSVNSSGGGGNGGSGLNNPVFPDGEVGTAYSSTPTPDGDGPYTFGGSDLPPGLTLNGATGEVSGTPTSAGTFFISYTVYDFAPGEENVGTSVVPITIYPLGSTFEFSTQFLNNGEVGTPYCDQYVVANAAGPVTFGASGLPDGVTLDPLTGAVTGTPTLAGSFLVTLTANDGVHTITTNLSMVIAPSSSSNLHWDFRGLPPALANVLYDRQPPIVLTADGGAAAITYSAVGLPAGITYDPVSGELSGTAVDQGEFPVTFTANDGTDTITLNLNFIVLPTTGGDVSQIVVNFWVTKAALKLGEDGRESWKVSAIYNADRRTGNRYDPATDAFQALLGSHVIDIDPGECTGSTPDQACSFKSPKEELPAVAAKLTPDKQGLSWSTKNDTINESVPGVLSQTVTLGNRAWRVLMSFDEKGSFRPALAFERTVFVLSKGALTLKAPGEDAAKLALLLADPNLGYDPGVSTLRVRILDGTTPLMDRDFTALGDVPKVGIDKNTGKPWIAFKTLKDEAATDQVRFAYSGSKGAIKLDLRNTDLTGIPAGEAHVTIELTIGARVYSTSVTFFEKSGKYGLAIP
jgi:hypothetical protein